MKKILRKVIFGQKRGKPLGYPTANLRYYKKDRIKFGVWAAEAIFGKKRIKGVCHVGPVPTFSIKVPRIEIYLFDFAKNLYNKKMKVGFLKYLRPIKKFKNKKSLAVQIKKDCKTAKSFSNI
jgi:riboflavin kinase/FMN adenylyltransferase